mmetsp:Transcript_22204/g.61802  ORF Transcript_22204/g.61802 Transcript_22204/m.61802 type:complete len:213 (+) Transcript_22204:258-896(+)
MVHLSVLFLQRSPAIARGEMSVAVWFCLDCCRLGTKRQRLKSLILMRTLFWLESAIVLYLSSCAPVPTTRNCFAVISACMTSARCISAIAWDACMAHPSRFSIGNLDRPVDESVCDAPPPPPALRCLLWASTCISRSTTTTSLIAFFLLNCRSDSLYSLARSALLASRILLIRSLLPSLASRSPLVPNSRLRSCVANSVKIEFPQYAYKSAM